jgi:hypothetical protein
MSTATLQESFVGLSLREPIPLGRRFHALPKVFRVYFPDDDVAIPCAIRRARRRDRPRPWLHQIAAAMFTRWSRTVATVRTIGRDSAAGQLFSQTADGFALSKIPHVVVPLQSVSDDALQTALTFCVQNEYPTAGYGSALPRGISHWDAATDEFETVGNIYDVPRNRGAAHPTIAGWKFDDATAKSRLPDDYTSSLRLALVYGEKYEQAWFGSGVSFEAFTRQARRILEQLEHDPFIPRNERFQSCQFDEKLDGGGDSDPEKSPITFFRGR